MAIFIIIQNTKIMILPFYGFLFKYIIMMLCKFFRLLNLILLQNTVIFFSNLKIKAKN